MNDPLIVVEPFQEATQQREAARLGMWVFLATEVLLFGGLFMSILVYRVSYGPALQIATEHLDPWLGGFNTALLLTSSLTMSLSVLAAREGKPRATCSWLWLTVTLGIAFLGVKAYEYHEEYLEGLMPGIGPDFPLPKPAEQLFFNVYYASTGLHAFHLACGVVSVSIFAFLVARQRSLRLPERAIRVELLGMYWHLVDMVWVFLFTALYLL